MAIIGRPTTSGQMRYLVRVKDCHGRYFPSKSFRRLVDAEKYERELKTKKDRDILALASAKRNLLFGDYLSEWFEYRSGEAMRGTASRYWEDLAVDAPAELESLVDTACLQFAQQVF